VLERQKCLKRCRHLLDAWSSQRLETLERCIARLLQPEAPAVAASPAPAGLEPVVRDMEARIEALFAELNADALHFQELYYGERRYLSQLDAHRCAGFGAAA
jgi:DNA primase